MLLFQEIAEYFKHEGHVIAQAPFTFTIALILVGGAIYWFVNGHYDERIKTLEARVGFETSRADHADISGIEQRFVEEAVAATAVERGNTIILRCEPIPQTVQLTVTRAAVHPSEYRVDGKKITLNEFEAKIVQDVVASEPLGDAFVRYVKRDASCQ